MATDEMDAVLRHILSYRTNQIPQQVTLATFCIFGAATSQLSSSDAKAISPLISASHNSLPTAVLYKECSSVLNGVLAAVLIEPMYVCHTHASIESPLRRSFLPRRCAQSPAPVGQSLFTQHFLRQLRHERLPHFVRPYDQQIIDICKYIQSARFMAV